MAGSDLLQFRRLLHALIGNMGAAGCQAAGEGIVGNFAGFAGELLLFSSSFGGI